MSNSKPPWEDSSIPDAVDNLPPITAYDKTGEPASPKPGDRLHTVHGYIIRETEKAILIEVRQVNETTLVDAEVPGGNRNMWFPLSQVSTIHHDTGADGAYDYIRAKEWICKQKDLI